MTICYTVIYSKMLKTVLFCLFLLNFSLLQLILFYFFVHIISFLVDLYPCMIILKYNQTFESSFFCNLNYPSLSFSYISVSVCILFHLIYYYDDKEICTVTPILTGALRGSVLPKMNQVKLSTPRL